MLDQHGTHGTALSPAKLHGLVTGPSPLTDREGRLRRLAAACLGLASALVPMSYDEAYWLGVAKLVENGRVLYEGALDNKTPPVYGLVWLLDAMPGPYQLWRGIAVGLLAWWILSRMAKLASTASWRITFIGVVVVLLAEFQLATELVALGFLVQGLASSRNNREPYVPAVMFLAALAFDPRVLVLVPGAYVMARQHNPRSSRAMGAVLAAGVLAGAVIVLAIPGFRFALIELNVASRLSDLRPAAIDLLLAWAVPILAFLPVVPSVDFSRREPGDAMFFFGAVSIATLSLLGIPHYWIYVAVPLALTPVKVGSAGLTRTGRALTALALIPALAGTIGAIRLHLDLAMTAREVSTFLGGSMNHGDTYVMFGAMPHLAVEMPSQLAMSSPTSHYMVDGTSRTVRYRNELSLALDGASAIVDDGGLDVPREFVFASHRGTRDVIDEQLDVFPCKQQFGVAIVHLRADRCETR